MSADMYEGCLYNLPEVLTWESVSNMEELTLVEINSMAGKSVVPMETFLKAIRMFNMAKRAEEEESLLNEELSNVADFYYIPSLLLQRVILHTNVVVLTYFITVYCYF